LHSGIDREIPIGAYEIADLGGQRPRAKHNGRQIHFWQSFSLNHRGGENYCVPANQSSDARWHSPSVRRRPRRCRRMASRGAASEPTGSPAMIAAEQPEPAVEL
jgi:hypothetical protein